ncbi:MAG: hypothetical protein KGR26_11025, partial [Cyanobacteria bacterium REEB65]|nr:hypothetical protein [Cyanobacteria bacterium REEB65]
MVQGIGQSQGSPALSTTGAAQPTSAQPASSNIDQILLSAMNSQPAASSTLTAQQKVVAAAKSYLDAAANAKDPTTAQQA